MLVHCVEVLPIGAPGHRSLHRGLLLLRGELGGEESTDDVISCSKLWASLKSWISDKSWWSKDQTEVDPEDTSGFPSGDVLTASITRNDVWNPSKPPVQVPRFFSNSCRLLEFDLAATQGSNASRAVRPTEVNLCSGHRLTVVRFSLSTPHNALFCFNLFLSIGGVSSLLLGVLSTGEVVVKRLEGRRQSCALSTAGIREWRLRPGQNFLEWVQRSIFVE